MSDKNMALLSQNEIDALIEFLTQQKGTEKIKGDILSQESINKLIQIIKSAQLLGKPLPNSVNTDIFSASILNDLGIINSSEFSLVFTIDEKEGVNLFASQASGDRFVITPSGLMKEPTSSARWGACIAPSTFHHIATKLELSYTEQTFSQVKKQFAKVMFGSEDSTIPSFYLP